MSKIRNKLIATLTIFAMLFTSLSAVMFASNNFAKAEGDGSAVGEVVYLELQDGASSGYLGEATDGKNYAGLRWETKIKKANYDNLVKEYSNANFIFGTLIAPAECEDYLNFDPEADKRIVFEDGDWYIYDGTEAITNKNGEKIYVSNIVNAKATSSLFNFGDDVSGEYVMRSAIRYEDFEEEGVNIKDGYATELVARAYVKILDAEGEVIDVKYSDADTVRSLRNSVAYNLAAGNFSEADATSLKKFAVEGEIIDASENDLFASNTQYAFFNVENTVVFPKLIGRNDVEFIINSKSAKFDSATGTVTFGAVDANKDAYIGAFIDDDFYYKKLTVATGISTVEEFLDIFKLGDIAVTSVTEDTELPLFDGYYVLANNLDFNGTGPTEKLTPTIGRGSSASNFSSYSNLRGNIGLTGTFDGNGYTISNLVTPQGGIFGVLDGAIKNVAFVDISSSSTSGTGLFAQVSFSQTSLENVYVRTNEYDTDGSTIISVISHYLHNEAEINSCYFEANLPLYNGMCTNSGQTNKGLQNESNTAIVVSKQILGHRFNYWASNQPYASDANSLGSYTESYLHGTNDWESLIAKYAIGSIYRYDDLSKLSTAYTEKQDDGITPTNRSNAVQEVFGKFSTNYFDVSAGRIAWKTDYSLYTVYYNSNEVSDNTISITTDGDKQFTISVKNGLGNVLENKDLKYVLECEDGSVVLTDAVLTINKAGDSILRVYTKDDMLIKVVTINVYRPLIDKTNDTPIILDSFGEEIAGIDKVYDASVEGGNAKVIDGNKVALSFEDEAEAADKDYVVYIETATNTIIYKAHYYTSYIKTPGELVDTFKLAKGDSEEATSFDELETFDGYYKLANNIDFTGYDMPTETLTYHASRSSTDGAKMYDVVNTIGLTGIFDGDGYAIYNLTLPEGGLFGVVSGTVQNVALINVDMATNTGVFGKYANEPAVFNNIYIEYNGTATSNKEFLAFYFDYKADFTNCYFKGNISVSGYTVKDGTSYNKYYSNANTAIVVTSRFVTRRSQNAYRCIYGSSSGSIVGSMDKYTVDSFNTGKIYCYPDLTTMINVYSDTQNNYSQTSYLKTLLDDSWDYTYFNFDTTNGLTWKVKTAE